MSTEPSSEGERLIKSWLSCQKRVRQIKSELTRAEDDLKVTANALAKWMLPDDWQPYEKISVWWGDSLIQVQAPSSTGNMNYENLDVTVRKRGRTIAFCPEA